MNFGLMRLYTFLLKRRTPNPRRDGPVDVSALAAILRRSIDGETITYDDLDAVSWSASGELDRKAERAYARLRWWISDEDIRERDAKYAQETRETLEWMLEELENEAATLNSK